MGKPKNKQGKSKKNDLEIVPKEETETEPLPTQRASDETVPKKEKWINKQRVLVFAARGINHRDRHLMKDLKTLMPHHRPESKMERAKTLTIINEMCDMKHCNKAVLFEGRRKRDLYMWVGHANTGPAAKFLVENIHTMAELKMTGNCLRGTRPLLSFDSKFNEIPHLKLLKEMFTQTFGVPNYHPKTQPFIDHVYTFTYLDRRIWFRNFQILSEAGALAEIGPRFVLNPVKIFDGAFTGVTIWKNPDYVSPARQRQMLKKASKDRYLNRVEKKAEQIATMPKHAYEGPSYGEIFETNNVVATAKKIAAREKKLAEAKAAEEMKQPTKSEVDITKKIKEKQLKVVKQIIEKKKQKQQKNKQNGESSENVAKVKEAPKSKMALEKKIKQKQMGAVQEKFAKTMKPNKKVKNVNK